MHIPVRLAALLLAAPAAAYAQAPTRSEVPIREVVQSDGVRRYGVPITVGGTAIEAGLDSGSSGLRILPGVLAAGEAQASGRSDTYSYGAGAKLDGVIGRATVTVGAVSGQAGVQLVQRVGCVATLPRCAAGRIPLSQYGIQGDGLPGEGFKAILGTNMADAEVPSILRAAGARRWIIELPRPGEGVPGRLVLNPTDAEAAGYSRLRIDGQFSARKGGLHDAIPGCVARDAPVERYCGAVLMDTGAPGVTIEHPDTKSAWPAGTAASLSLGDPARPVAIARFVTEQRAQASHMTFRDGHDGEGNGPRAILAGLLPFFAWSVLYDPEKGEIGVKPRPPAPGGPTPAG